MTDRDKTLLAEKLKTVGKSAELGGEDPIIDQTITKLLDYATDRHRKDLEDIAAKLRAIEERFGMTSDLFSQKFHRGALGDDEEFFRWDTLLEMQRLAHPFSLAFTLHWVATTHQLRREAPAAQEQAEVSMAFSQEQGFALWVPGGTVLRGWALTEQGQQEEGIAQMRQGMTAWQATGAEVDRPYYLALLAEGYGKAGQAEAGLHILAEALTVVAAIEERYYEAELYRLQGELLLARATKHDTEAETCFRHALDISRRQQARSLELRAAMSLARLWQRQGQRAAARNLLAPIYGWFTEGFDTADLQEARGLLEALNA